MARILVVEDSDDVCQLLCVALAHEGHAAHGVKTAAEGSRALERGNYEVMIADMRLPDGSGAELAEKALTRAIEPLLTTGHPEEMRRLELRGIDYLRKPFLLRDLARLVDRRVTRARRRRADRLMTSLCRSQTLPARVKRAG
jgi:DNA-binding response OmpR family regulator